MCSEPWLRLRISRAGTLRKSAVQNIMAHAPGRVELLGNHTDYNEGVVLSAAIDRGVTVHGEARSDGRVALTSLALGEAGGCAAGRI